MRRFGALLFFVFCCFFASRETAHAASADLSVTHSFASTIGDVDGSRPSSGVTLAADGAILGFTSSGGDFGRGGIFRIDAGGLERMIYSFSQSTGVSPVGNLIVGAGGAIFGTLKSGGSSDGGVVFRIEQDGTNFRKLHEFRFSEDGSLEPWAPNGLMLAEDGNFYGTSERGGNAQSYGDGTIFRMTPTGQVMVLHRFDITSMEGSNPLASMIQAKDGFLYGTTSSGGANELGTVFRIDVRGKFQLLDSFSAVTGGSSNRPLTEAESGTIYGITQVGGAYGSGTAFKLYESGKIRRIHDFGHNPRGAVMPSSGLAQSSDGNFYGTTSAGGHFGRGTIYRMTASGAVEVIWEFGADPTDGLSPLMESLVLSDGRTALGTCQMGGIRNAALSGYEFGDGVVFAFDVAVHPRASQ